MPTAADLAVSPLAAKSGVAIPFSVGDPIGSFVFAFTAVASAQLALSDDAEDHIALIWATQDVAIRFGTDAASVADSTWVADQFILKKGQAAKILIRDASFRVIGVSLAGSLYVSVFRKWEALDKEVQQRNTI